MSSATNDCSCHPSEELTRAAKDAGMAVTDEAFARLMDERDPLRHLRSEFHYPTMSEIGKTDLNIVKPDEDCIYLCGNSLGLCPKNVRKYLNAEVDKWEQTGVQGHMNGAIPWAFCDEACEEEMAKIVGCKREEVGLMNGLTVNLHLLMISFYRPSKERYKILLESKAFPSDHYAFESQCRLHGINPEEAMICVEPREGDSTLRTEDILAVIEREGDQIAMVCFSGVQYYTGQLFDIPTITAAAKAKGCTVGWDLAHAVGNVPLYLHDWGVDFACWCTYKYLNSGAGSLAGMFIHETHSINDFPKLLGWWGHKMSSRFVMDNAMDLSPGPHGYRISNPSIFASAPLVASLDVYKQTSMQSIRQKSLLLTGYMELLIKRNFQKQPLSGQDGTNGINGAAGDVTIDIFTPSDPKQRGAQLSLVFSIGVEKAFQELEKRGVVCDKRLPSVIRVAAAPLYNSFNDVYRFIQTLKDVLASVVTSP